MEYIGLRIGYFDIETTPLQEENGSILCAAVADGFGEVKSWRRDEYEQEHLGDDRQLCLDMRDFLTTEFDIIVTWYGRQFDLPFLNKRLLAHGENIYESRLHIDGFDLIKKGEMSRSLNAVSTHFGEQDDEVHKTPFDEAIWNAAVAGQRDAMNYIVDHCEKDVLLLRRTFRHLTPRIKRIHN